MSLWVDRYRPRELSKLDFAKDNAKHLKNLIDSGDFPHLLFYGPSGAGKKTRVMCLLRELYGPGVDRLRVELMNFTGPSEKKIAIHAIKSNYHIEVNPSEVKIYDRFVVMELIKNVAQSYQLDTASQREFKVVVITEAEALTKDAQHALRRTMEKYTSTCRLILIANSCSRILPAILSRCLSIRMPAPTIKEITPILTEIARRESLTLSPELAVQIAQESDRNLRRAILMLQVCRVSENFTLKADQEIKKPDWLIYIKQIANLAIREQSAKVLLEIRTKLYELMVHNIPSDIIFKYLTIELLKSCDLEISAKVAHCAAYYEHRLRAGSKDIFHLEAFVANFMAIFKNYIKDVNVDFFEDFDEDF